MAKKNNLSPMIFALIIVAVIMTVLFLIKNNKLDSIRQMTDEVSQIQNAQDLDAVGSQLDTNELDQVDTELDQLNTEVSTY